MLIMQKRKIKINHLYRGKRDRCNPLPPTERFFRIFLDFSKGFNNPKPLLSVDVQLFLLIIISNFGGSDCYDYQDSGIYELSLWNEICKWVSVSESARSKVVRYENDTSSLLPKCISGDTRAKRLRMRKVSIFNN